MGVPLGTWLPIAVVIVVLALVAAWWVDHPLFFYAQGKEVHTMKKFSNFMAVIGVIAVIAMVLITIRYGAVRTTQTDEALYQRRLHWMDRNR